MKNVNSNENDSNYNYYGDTVKQAFYDKLAANYNYYGTPEDKSNDSSAAMSSNHKNDSKHSNDDNIQQNTEEKIIEKNDDAHKNITPSSKNGSHLQTHQHNAHPQNSPSNINVNQNHDFNYRLFNEVNLHDPMAQLKSASNSKEKRLVKFFKKNLSPHAKKIFVDLKFDAHFTYFFVKPDSNIQLLEQEIKGLTGAEAVMTSHRHIDYITDMLDRYTLEAPFTLSTMEGPAFK
jgi:hypothetical protein